MLIEFATYAAIILYIISSIMLLLSLKQDALQSVYNRIAITVACLAVTSHTLILHSLVIHESGLNLGFSNSFSLISWSIILLLLISSIRLPIINLGIPLLLIAAFSIMLTVLFPSEVNQNETLLPIIKLHIILSMLAYSVLSLGSLQAILLYIQDIRLHNHKQDKFTLSLPSLQKMEKILFLLLSIGFLLLTVALALGLPYAQSFFTHKIIFSLIAWLVFGTLLVGHKLAGWRGRTAIRWTLLGIISLLLAFFGTKLVFEFILNH